MKRKEKDLLGEREVEVSSYYGIHTLRAKENFDIKGKRVNEELIKAISLVKLACVEANIKAGN